eukprot:2213143-Amphidinium_carterae.1
MQHQDLYGSCSTLWRRTSVARGSSGRLRTLTPTSCSPVCSSTSGAACAPAPGVSSSSLSASCSPPGAACAPAPGAAASCSPPGAACAPAPGAAPSTPSPAPS